ncbi:MAG: hypothetical protein J6P66_00420 [Bacteroidaceae bacterium]|nr:hypothetical protein [Bacteroidaceae bacterium]
MKFCIPFFIFCFVGCITVETPIQHNSGLDYTIDKNIGMNSISNVEPDTISAESLQLGNTRIVHSVADYVVKKTIRVNKQLYVIDLERSDSVYRVFSHYDGIKNPDDIKLHKHDIIRVELIEPSEFERFVRWDAYFVYMRVKMEYYNVYINKYLYRNTFRSPYYFEIRFCDDLNGPYLRYKKD